MNGDASVNTISEHASAADTGVLSFRASTALIAPVEAAAAQEGISRADVARRALLRDLGLASAFVPGGPTARGADNKPLASQLHDYK